MKRWKKSVFSALYFLCGMWDAPKRRRFRYTPSSLRPIIMVFSENMKNNNNHHDYINIQCILTLRHLFIIRQPDFRIKDNTHWKSPFTREIKKRIISFHQITAEHKNETKQNKTYVNNIRMIKWIFYFGIGALLKLSDSHSRQNITWNQKLETYKTYS